MTPRENYSVVAALSDGALNCKCEYPEDVSDSHCSGHAHDELAGETS